MIEMILRRSSRPFSHYGNSSAILLGSDDGVVTAHFNKWVGDDAIPLYGCANADIWQDRARATSHDPEKLDRYGSSGYVRPYGLSGVA